MNGTITPLNSKSPQKKRKLSRRRKRRQLMYRFRLFVCCTAVLFIACAAFLTVRANTRPIPILLKMNPAEIVQGEPIPAFKAVAVYEGTKLDRYIDRKKEIKVRDLLKELNSGKGYSFSCNADTNKDSTYPVDLILDKRLDKKLKGDWRSKVTLAVSDGTLTVRNVQGIWEGTKFKSNDGSYLSGDFLTSNGNTYYFDLNGEMVTGEYQIGLKTCVFNEDGILESKKEAQLDPNLPMIALTFDDGPSERTSELLDILDKYNARATFFMLGKNVGHYPDTVKKMKENGNELGNHSFNHPQLPKLSPEDIKKQIKDTNNAIKDACGSPADVLRPPYGAINDIVSANVGMPMILWNVDTLDWKSKDAQATSNTAIASAADGAVILMHDTHSWTIDAAAQIIPELTRQGYQLVTIRELTKAKGIALEDGKTYRQEL